jgi:type II secretory pathway predicted ATPase ExeA
MSLLNDYFGFSHPPFSRDIPAAKLFAAAGHQQVQGRLAFALHERLPALITGDIGLGKSTAIRAFVHSLDQNLFPLVYLPNPRLDVAALYAQILLALHIEPAYSFARSQPQLRETLRALARKNRFPLLIVDDACSGPEYLTGKRPREMEPAEAKKETRAGLFFVGGVVRRAAIEGRIAPA